MLTIRKYVMAESLSQAYDLYQNKNNTIIGGMLWLKMQDRTVDTAIDLSNLGLNTIEETENTYEIGAMVTLRDLELHSGLNTLTGNAFTACVKPIVGVQFRNLATVGGSVYGRYGFSDLLTLLLAMNADVVLYKNGIVNIHDFVKMPYTRDIVVKVIVSKNNGNVYYTSFRNTKTDFPVLTCCVYHHDNHTGACIGARPGKALDFVMNEEETVTDYANRIHESCPFGSNMRSSASYRGKLCRNLTEYAIRQLQKGESSC
ncbi:MAG: FAD binding domain-containing protein [Erysipelotrichaceae bacterium]|nr:FAD binding domain-containing protein [Erysipelotrichaceae bacterium]